MHSSAKPKDYISEVILHIGRHLYLSQKISADKKIAKFNPKFGSSVKKYWNFTDKPLHKANIYSGINEV